LGLILSFDAISLFDSPATANSMTWRCRVDSVSNRACSFSSSIASASGIALAAIALRMLSRSRTSSNGFSMKSNAPTLIAATAISTSPCPVIRITGEDTPETFTDQIKARHTGHSYVRNNAIEALPAGDRGQESFGGRKAGRFDALTDKIKSQRIEHGLIVVHHRDMQLSAHVRPVFAIGSVKYTAPPCEEWSSHNLPP